MNLLADWCERGVRVVVVTQQIDLNGAVGRMAVDDANVGSRPSWKPSRFDSAMTQFRSKFRKRRAFVMTETELKVIAALAIIGLRSIPKNG